MEIIWHAGRLLIEIKESPRDTIWLDTKEAAKLAADLARFLLERVICPGCGGAGFDPPTGDMCGVCGGSGYQHESAREGE